MAPKKRNRASSSSKLSKRQSTLLKTLRVSSAAWSKVDTETCELLAYQFGLYTVVVCQKMGDSYVDVEFQSDEIANGVEICGFWPEYKIDWAPQNIMNATRIVPGHVTAHAPSRDLTVDNTESCVTLAPTNPWPTQWSIAPNGKVATPNFPPDVYPNCTSNAPFLSPAGQLTWLGPQWPTPRFI